MADVVIFDPLDTIVANRVTSYLLSIHTPDYSSNPNAIINPDLSGVSGVDQKYWKVDTGDVVEMSQAEKDDIDIYITKQNESAEKRTEIEIQEDKYYKMLKRLDNKKTEWGMTNADIRGFIEDLLGDPRDIRGLYEHRITNPLVTFIDGYDATNPLFTQAVQDELIDILNS